MRIAGEDVGIGMEKRYHLENGKVLFIEIGVKATRARAQVLIACQVTHGRQAVVALKAKQASVCLRLLLSPADTVWRRRCDNEKEG